MANPFPHSPVVYFDFALTQDLNICSSTLAPQLLFLNTPQYLLLTAQYPCSVFAFFSFRMPPKRRQNPVTPSPRRNTRKKAREDVHLPGGMLQTTFSVTPVGGVWPSKCYIDWY